MKQRQGDVLIVSVLAIPSGSKKLDHLILAHGEVTGHKHQVINGEAELYEKDGKMYLSVISDEVKLNHEEHAVQTLEKGIYEVIIQREYIPNSWQRVAD